MNLHNNDVIVGIDFKSEIIPPDITFLEVPLSCIICIIYIFIGISIHTYKEIYHEPPWIHESSVACIIGREVLIEFICFIDIS